VHLAEGSDEIAQEEFAFVRAQSLLAPTVVLIHSTALTAEAAAGASLVWSPRSNIELYEQAADIRTARAAGVEIALAPDCGITGSTNLLDELRYAAAWNKAQPRRSRAGRDGKRRRRRRSPASTMRWARSARACAPTWS
jgi:cytosine/adenosine deaminase-related metal-dependent hydrolase